MARSAIPTSPALSSPPSSLRWAHAPPRTSARAEIHEARPGTGPLPKDGAKPTPDAPSLPPHEVELRRRLASGRGSLPVLPRVASVAMRLASDPEAPFDELDVLLRRDPPLAARLLSVANSALYRRGGSVTSTRAAIGRIGLVRTRDLLFQAVYTSYSAGIARYQAQVEASIDRSVRCAAVAPLIAERLDLSVEGAYLTGLLHDIGESRIYRLLETIAVPTTADAEDLVARYHEQAGRELAASWRLPDAIAAACGAHHDVAAPSPTIRLVQATDLLVRTLSDPGAEELAAALGLDLAAAESLRQAARDIIAAGA